MKGLYNDHTGGEVMEDHQIIDLYWQRDETAIAETERKYGRYCYAIAFGILQSNEDAEESVNDTYIGAWNAMPPHRPENLPTFLGKITRHLSLKTWRERTAIKRGGGEVPLALEELEGCIPAGQSVDEHLEAAELAAVLDDFLGALPVEERRVFLCRYWYFDSIHDISVRFGFGQSKVKMMLKRTREKLLVRLNKEEIWV